MDICPSCQTENGENAKFCKNCGTKLVENQLEVISFKKHLLNWKYYMVVVITSIILGFNYGMVGGGEFFESDAINAMNSIAFFTSIFIVVKYKNGTILKRIGMFFASYFVTLLCFFTFFGLLSGIISKFVGNSADKYITQMMKQNSKLPVKVNDDILIFKYERGEENKLKQYLKFINHDKNQIMGMYQNNIQLIINDFEQEELKTSCPMENIKEMLESGLIFEMEYYDKYDNKVFSFSIDNEQCLPFYEPKGSK